MRKHKLWASIQVKPTTWIFSTLSVTPTHRTTGSKPTSVASTKCRSRAHSPHTPSTYGEIATSGRRIVVEVRGERALDFSKAHPLPYSIVEHLIPLDPADTEVLSLGVGEIEPADARY